MQVSFDKETEELREVIAPIPCPDLKLHYWSADF